MNVHYIVTGSKNNLEQDKIYVLNLIFYSLFVIVYVLEEAL